MPKAVATPPFRTSLLMANGVPFGTGNGDVQTTKDWWLYWNQLGDQANSNSKLATAGTHGDRPMPESMPDGALYYENDRGVLYANTLGTWQYVAGTMYGTLSPDERPTDLGTHDAGFDFRGTDQPREFLWSQTEWIEVTAVQYGTHLARPNPATIVEGALYVESDRGGVIYQRETPAGTPLWQYLAGTMWGTLVPDQRPTDLGVHDAGFDFRTNVAPPREFIWDQTAWIETTSVSGASLTHPNVVTKVGSTAGQIVEGGITDESTANSDRLHITAAGNVGIATPSASAPFQVGAGTPLIAGIADVYGLNRSRADGTALLNILTTDALAADKGGTLGLGGAGGSNPYAFAILAGRAEGTSFAGYFQICVVQSGGSVTERMRITSTGGIVFPTLASSNPGAGTKQLYYDPADGNRVKFTG